MNPLHEERVTLMLPPQVKNNGAFGAQTPLYVGGAGAAKIELLVGATDVIIGTTNTATPPILEECDTVGGSYTEIASAKLAAVIAATSGDKVFAIDVPNLGQRKAFVRVKAPTAGNASTGAMLCIRGVVTKQAVGPVNAADRGYAAHITL